MNRQVPLVPNLGGLRVLGGLKMLNFADFKIQKKHDVSHCPE